VVPPAGPRESLTGGFRAPCTQRSKPSRKRAIKDVTFHAGYTPHTANANETDEFRLAHGYGWRVTDLRADWSADPLADLEALLARWLPQRGDYIARALRPQAAPGYGVPGDDR
jgi:hypothetical protein